MQYSDFVRTFSIQERLNLPGKAQWGSEDYLMPTFRGLSIFKREICPIDEALAPLCRLSDLEELSRESFESLVERVSKADRPAWYELFQRWSAVVDQADGNVDRGYLNVVEHLAENAIAELRQNLASRHADYGEQLAELFAATVPAEALGQAVIPSALLVQKRDYSHLSAHQFFNLLKGATLREEIFLEFPVMARMVTEILADWVTSCEVLALQLVRDQRLLAANFGLEISKLCRIRANLGDRHKSGLTVAILETDEAKVVYKPRRAFGEMLIAKVCRLLPELDDLLPYLPKIVEVQDHHWQEFCEPKDFRSSQASVVAQKLGVINAILYFLMADDMHHENVQICANEVAIIDAECVLNVIRPVDFMQIDVKNIAAEALSRAAYSVGISPQPISSANLTGHPLDISVLGYSPGGTVNLRVPQLRKLDDGTYTLSNEAAVFSDEDPIRKRRMLLAYGKEFIAGFQKAAVLLSNKRSELLGLIFGQPQLVVRVLPRPTMIYSKILVESYHPTFMRDAALRDACLAKLLPRYLNKSFRIPLLQREMTDLRNGYIPYVEYDLRHENFLINGVPIKTKFEGLKLLERHIMSIDESEIRRQCAYLDMSVASANLRGTGQPWLMNKRLEEYGIQESTEELPEEIDKLVVEGLEEVVELLIQDNGEAGFATMNAVAPDCWSLGPAGADLYNGSAGVHLMFDRLHVALSNSRFEEAYAAIETSALRLGDAVNLDPSNIRKNTEALNIGMFDQIAGIAISQALCIKRPEHEERARESLKRCLIMLEHMADADTNFDVISGAAGAIFLSGSLRNEETDSCDSLTKKAIDRLISTYKQDEYGVFWPAADCVSGLTGFSHGAVGVAAALSLGSMTTQYRVEECIRIVSRVLAWEEAHFDKLRGWEDRRPESMERPDSGNLQAWCHGAGGAYIARQIIREQLEPHLDDYIQTKIADQINTALGFLEAKTSEMIANSAGDCLCHGTVGNLIILQNAAEKQLYNSTSLNNLVKDMVSHAKKDGWRLGGLPGVPSNSFMMGTPGIVWGLAHLRSPGHTPLNPLLMGI